MPIDNSLTFIITIILLSVTPGPCMTLALNSGMTVGVKRTQFMGLGDYIGLIIFAGLSILGVDIVIKSYPNLFILMQYIGALYLIYLGVKSWRNPPPDFSSDIAYNITNGTLFKQGFISLISNPKAIVFYGAFFPQFINPNTPLLPQISFMIPTIIISEFISINIYATGGKILRASLKSAGGKILNRISGSMLMGVGIWLGIK